MSLRAFEDVYEMVDMIQQSQSLSNKHIRPTKVRAMFASRACRSSIMIGQTLDKRTMCRVLDNLETLEAPWNCPHGRHLFVLRNATSRIMMIVLQTLLTSQSRNASPQNLWNFDHAGVTQVHHEALDERYGHECRTGRSRCP